MAEPLKVVIGEDDVLLREGIARLLTEAGFEVVAHTGDADDLLRRALAHRPDVAVVDVQMPPGHGDDGLRAATELREQRPETGILVLSQFYEDHYARDLMGERPAVAARGPAPAPGLARLPRAAVHRHGARSNDFVAGSSRRRFRIPVSAISGAWVWRALPATGYFPHPST